MAHPYPHITDDLPAASVRPEGIATTEPKGMPASARHADMLRSAVDWLWETDTRLDLTYLSPSIAAVLEVPAQLMLGRSLYALLGLRDDDPAAGRLIAAVTARRPFREQVAGFQAGSQTGTACRVTGVPYYDPGTDRFTGYRGTGSALPGGAGGPGDEHAAGQLLDMLEAALARKDQLEWELSKEGDQAFQSRLASIVHELGTPLNAIMDFAEAIRDCHLGDDLARYRDYAGNIHESGRHLLEVINGLLNMARIDAGAAIADNEELDVAEIAASVLRMLEDRAGKAQVALLNDLAAGEPGIRAERRALRQILINLLTNAIKYTPPGGAAGVESRCDGGSLAVTVWDTGVGIAPEDQEKVFQRSYRVTHSGLERPGSGLGLAISRHLARAMGGDITLVSSPGEGSRLTLWLPLAEAPEGAAEDTGQNSV